jgi:hypothetical protein
MAGGRSPQHAPDVSGPGQNGLDLDRRLKEMEEWFKRGKKM